MLKLFCELQIGDKFTLGTWTFTKVTGGSAQREDGEFFPLPKLRKCRATGQIDFGVVISDCANKYETGR
jgi:hypothetical protein